MKIDRDVLIESLKLDLEVIANDKRANDTEYTRGWDNGFNTAITMVIERYKDHTL